MATLRERILSPRPREAFWARRRQAGVSPGTTLGFLTTAPLGPVTMSQLELVLSLIVGSIAGGMAAYMFLRYVRASKLHHLLWGLGLALWAISSFGQAASLYLDGWVEIVPVYRLYYFAAIALVGFLGAGTLGLIWPKSRLYPAFNVYIAYFTTVLAVAVALGPVDLAALRTPVVGGEGLAFSTLIFTLPINVPGGVFFIGGAAYSIFRTRKLFAVFITLGAIMPALGGIISRLGVPAFLPFTDFVGISFLSAGVYLSVRVARPASQPEGSAA